MQITSYKQALEYLAEHTPQVLATQFPGEIGLERAKRLMQELGNPQESLKIIHVAGTSGKGSTCTILSHLLASQGLSVGLTLSPHLMDVRERIQINNQLITQEEFYTHLQTVSAAVERVPASEYGVPTFFEIIIGLAFVIFKVKGVDYVVMETGLGGLLDGTNMVKRQDKVVLLSRIGYDHMHILGERIEDIAYQKAHIIQKGNVAFSIQQEEEVVKVFNRIAEEKGGTLQYITPENYTIHSEEVGRTEFSFIWNTYALSHLQLGLQGAYQVENASLALSAFFYCMERDKHTIVESRLRSVLEELQFNGRQHTVTVEGQTLLLDGAHNVQKMEALLQTLNKLYPGKSTVFLIAFKKGKDFDSMLHLIARQAHYIVLTSFVNTINDTLHTSETVSDLKSVLDAADFYEVTVEPDLHKAVDVLLKRPEDIKVITGSLYLLGDVYSLINKR